jgi:hypothetical protein
MPAVQSVPPPFVVDVGLAIRRVLLRAADAIVPPWAAAWEKSMGIGTTHVIGTLAELGVPDALGDDRLSAADLAARLDVDAGALHRVLRWAAVERLVRIDRGGRFRLTAQGRTLRSDAPSTLRPWARYMVLGSSRGAWADLTESVRTGGAAFERVHGTSVWDWFAAHPEEEQLFAAAMRSITEFDGPGIARASVWPDEGTLCDVAGGAGTLLGEILSGRPKLRGVLVEASGVLAEAEKHLTAVGVRDRVELVEGDLFGTVQAEADVYVLKNVLHDWDDATSARIVATVRATMAPGSRLVLIDQLQEPNRPHPFASLSDVQMLTQCVDGRERSRAELQGLLSGAGRAPSAGSRFPGRGAF